jgi:hypothetical protein
MKRPILLNMKPAERKTHHDHLALMTENEVSEALGYGISLGKLLWEDGYKDFEEWAVKMNQHNPGLRTFLKGIYIGLCTASQDRSVFTPLAQVHKAHLDKILGLTSVQTERLTSRTSGPRNEPRAVLNGDLNELSQLKSKGLLSDRAYKACRKAKLRTLNDARLYMKAHGGFGHIKGCGTITDHELSEILKAGKIGQASPDKDNGLPKDLNKLRNAYNIHFAKLSPGAKAHLRATIPILTPSAVYQYLVGLGKQLPRSLNLGPRLPAELEQFRRLLIAAQESADISDVLLVKTKPPVQTKPKPAQKIEGRQKPLNNTVLAILESHKHPLHVRSIVRLLPSNPALAPDVLEQEIRAGLHGPIIPLRNGFIGLPGRAYGTLPPAPFELTDSLYRRAIWTHFLGSPVKELCSYLLGCSTISKQELTQAVKRKMKERGYSVDWEGCLCYEQD